MATPSFTDAILDTMSRQISGINLALPAEVVKYDAATTSVSVKPLIKRRIEAEDETTIVEKRSIIEGVPLVFPGLGSSRITFPVNPGDLVLLVFASESLDRWLAKGGDVDPVDDRHGALSDAVAIPGISDFKSASAADTTATVVEATQLKLGGQTAAQGVIKGTLYRAAEDTFLAAEAVWLIALLTYIIIPVPTPPQTATYTAAHGIYAAALVTFQAAITTSVSTKVKTE